MANPYENWPQASEVCVIGAGTMGAGIAAHLANIGFGVTLLDISCDAAQAGLDRAKGAKPPHFFVPERAADIRLGSIESDLEWVTEADWVCEAVVEKLDVKRDLFAKLDPLLRPDTMVSINTSGLQIGLLAEGRSESFRRRFLGTHFFNPPRYLKLLELIPTGDTAPDAIAAMTRFLEDRVARRVVLAKDTPGFIANRYGMWSMFKATHVAEELRLTVEQVDAITGPFLGRPRSGSFRLNDLVGLDIMQDIARNLIERCPNDPHTDALRTSHSMKELIDKGWLGEKAGRGYYQRQGKELLALDLSTLSYRQKQDVEFDSLNALAKKPLGERVREALHLKDEVGEYLREYLVPTLNYANYLKEEISHSVQDFDRVMMWGFGWEKGPFAMIDAIGADALQIETKKFYEGAQILDFTGNYVPTRPEPQFATIKDFPIIDTGEAHVLRDLGDGVTAFSLTTKMGSITTTAVRELTERIDSGKIGRLVLTGEAKAYSVGFDLNFFAQSIEAGDYEAIDRELLKLQRLGELLEQVPSVAAVFGYALGAGFELAVSCTRIAALADTQLGLPEAKVGLLPGGRGTVLARLFNQEDAKDVARAAMHLTEGVVSTNADDARRYGYMRESDLTVYHPDRLIADAKALVLSIKPEPRPTWKSFEGPITGMIDRLQQEAIAAGRLTEYDEVIGDEIKAVFTKSSSYDDALAKEREGFVQLCRRALTLARIKHMLETGKPLRN